MRGLEFHPADDVCIFQRLFTGFLLNFSVIQDRQTWPNPVLVICLAYFPSLCVFPRGKRCCETIIFLEAKTGFATSHHGPILASAAVALLYIFVLFSQFSKFVFVIPPASQS